MIYYYVHHQIQEALLWCTIKIKGLESIHVIKSLMQYMNIFQSNHLCIADDKRLLNLFILLDSLHKVINKNTQLLTEN